jgi:hypothetical protein
VAGLASAHGDDRCRSAPATVLAVAAAIVFALCFTPAPVNHRTARPPGSSDASR